MREPNMALLGSVAAIVCHKHHAGEMGGATEWFVCLADGFLLSCGAEGLSEARAYVLANAINTAGPDLLDRKELERWVKA